ncbi:aromatic/alkene monooxygenase hydroxylase FAD-binding subunit MmoC [Candidatus Methylocalor cossyra]|uniref:Methane monooxygenase component C n=1 Tax=Candidatus Methylocalor cossyra TaxID=3108543 RepID=A0ABM9NEI6_9GAMM
MSAIHTIHVTTDDGETVHFQCRSDEDVITAALRQDIILMASCRQGGCATCKAFCAEGDYRLVGCSVQALPPDEEEQGQVLLCRCYPDTDLALEVPYSYSRIAFAPEEDLFTATVVSVATIASNTLRLHLRRVGSNGERKVRFEAGQYMNLQIPGTDLTRAYSPANTSNEDGDLEFLIRLLPDGAMSNFLRNGIQVGQAIQVRGPMGVFGLKENGLRPRYFVAGGTGLAPVLSMIRRMREWGEPQEARLYFGVNTVDEVFFLDELQALAAAMPTLTVRVCVWHPEANWDGERGNAVEILSRDLAANPAKPDVYLCGPPAMVDAAHRVCAQFGIPKDQIFQEKFLPSGPCGAACASPRVHEHPHS